jgi:hypothetical protein
MKYPTISRIFFILVAFLLTVCLSAVDLRMVNSADAKSPSDPTIRYIESAGDGTFPCPKNNPCNFYSAYLYAPAGDIFIFKQGTYTVDDMGYPDPDSLHVVVDLDVKTLHLYGGWDGNPTLGVDAVIDPLAYQSVLYGESTNRVVRILGSANTSTLAGFLISGGYAENSLSPDCVARGASSPICGGGIYVHDASPSIHDNIITMNVAVNKADKEGVGGGIYVHGSPAVKIFDNNIIGNSANSTLGDGFGGGIALFACGDQTEVYDNVIQYNSAAQDPNMGWGAGALVDQGDSIQFNHNEVKLNNQDGLVSMIGSGMIVFDSTITMHDNQFTDNQPWSVIEISGSLVDFQRNYVRNPDAKVGLLISSGGNLGTTNVINNMFLHHDYANVLLLGHSTDYANVAFYFNTVAFNATGIADCGYVIEDYVTGLFSHGIVADQYYGFKNEGHVNGTILIGYHLMYDDYYPYGDDGVDEGFGYVYGYEGDPKFIDPVGGDYHIQLNSAARDLGPGKISITDDFDRQRRPNNTLGWSYPADLGADEYCLPRYFPFIRK